MKYLSILLLSLTFVLATPSFAEEEQRTAGAEKEPSKKEELKETYKNLSLFGDVFDRVRAQYVEEKESEELIENAIQGMLSNLDPHSSYLDADDFQDMQVQTRGEFGGLGIEVTMENGFVKVVSPIDDTPAFKAGLEAGDYITHLDEEPVMGLSLSEAVDKMRGRVGSDIVLTIAREGADESFDVSITRDIIKITSVRNKTEYGDVGYLRITTFNQNTMPGLQKSIKELDEELGSNIKGYVLDLRNNPGGLLNQAILVSDAFLDKGEIVSTRGRNAKDTKRDNATQGDLLNGKPLVVLINGGSASASEIVAGALQDHRRAIIMGTQSFGKGSVQTIIPLPEHGAMRLTTARYYTPSGRSIQAEGIEPDIIVEQAKIEELASSSRTREGDLRGALNNDSKVKSPSDKKSDQEAANDNEKPPVKDYQLERAVDLLRGLTMYGDRILEQKNKEEEKEQKISAKQ